jgi:hypothetical protein
MAGSAHLRRLHLLGIAAVLVLDRFNILVDHETWLRRKMPERPF